MANCFGRMCGTANLGFTPRGMAAHRSIVLVFHFMFVTAGMVAPYGGKRLTRGRHCEFAVFDAPQADQLICKAFDERTFALND